MLTLKQLELFRAVAQCRNFRRAAKQMGCCQANVTVQVQALERELGAVLFERHRFSRDVRLTTAGNKALTYADRLLGLAEEVKTAVQVAPVLREASQEGPALHG